MTPGKLRGAAAIGAVVIVIVVLIVASHQRVSLFEPGRARGFRCTLRANRTRADRGLCRGDAGRGVDRSTARKRQF